MSIWVTVQEMEVFVVGTVLMCSCLYPQVSLDLFMGHTANPTYLSNREVLAVV